jgi:4a-hydroxytetrahydrobiopterin dehydratase
MSEQGWKDFVAAEDLEDWAVLHGGPTAVFRTGSMLEAAQLAVVMTAFPGVAGTRVSLTITDQRLAIRLTREMWGTEADHIELARALSAVAREHGATPDLAAVQEVQVAIAAKPDDIDLGFWRAVLGYDPMADDNGIDPLGHGSTVWMQGLPEAKPLRHAMHIDVSVPREHAEARLAAALAAGGTIVDESEAPGAWILADRAGNKVCIAAWPDGAVLGSADEEPTQP